MCSSELLLLIIYLVKLKMLYYITVFSRIGSQDGNCGYSSMHQRRIVPPTPLFQSAEKHEWIFQTECGSVAEMQRYYIIIYCSQLSAIPEVKVRKVRHQLAIVEYFQNTIQRLQLFTGILETQLDPLDKVSYRLHKKF